MGWAGGMALASTVLPLSDCPGLGWTLDCDLSRREVGRGASLARLGLRIINCRLESCDVWREERRFEVRSGSKVKGIEVGKAIMDRRRVVWSLALVRPPAAIRL